MFFLFFLNFVTKDNHFSKFCLFGSYLTLSKSLYRDLPFLLSGGGRKLNLHRTKVRTFFNFLSVTVHRYHICEVLSISCISQFFHSSVVLFVALGHFSLSKFGIQDNVSSTLNLQLNYVGDFCSGLITKVMQRRT